ncbi:MAG: acyclic terpene utilization AtuA family protein [Proteobacteria bacterium]|nr:acyclic terpene utilization AtuA family protein [Pseudomonadota bacterium]
MKPIRIITPTGHLGTTPLEKGSFERGCAQRPDYIIADSGSADIGPYPLGADRPASSEVWQRHDLEAMLVAARKLGIPMIIGSASDTGTNRGVDQYVRLIKEIAAQHKLAPFKLAAVYSEVPVSDLIHRVQAGETIAGLNGRPTADLALLKRTDRVVAVMGVEPIRAVLRDGADVIIAGRSGDCAIFAAPILNAGGGEADAYFCGKAMECASFCGEPFMGKETILGRVDSEGVFLTAMHPAQRCTPASVASHAMYERLNPFREYVPGGFLDMSRCRYEQVDEKTTRVTGQTFVADAETWIKLEGAGKVAERALFILGIRDPYTIANLDRAIDWTKGKLAERFGPVGGTYDVFYHDYGRGAVMGEMEPTPAKSPLEVGIVVEVTCDDAARAEVICHIAAKNLFYARLPDVKGTAGTAAIMSDEVLHARPAYEWTLNHIIKAKDQSEFFSTRFETIHA